MKTVTFGTDKPRTPVLYALIRFRPYSEIGEFANIGAIICAPTLGLVEAKTIGRSQKRVLDFFAPYDRASFNANVQSAGELLDNFIQNHRDLRHEALQTAFENFIFPREAVLTFSNVRISFTHHPENELQRVFEYYVQSDFRKNLSPDQQQVQEVKEIIERLGKRYVKDFEITNGDVKATFPLANIRNGQAFKLIKPLYLEQENNNKIFDHGDRWVSKIKRLQDVLPQRTLVTIKGHQQNKAVVEITNELKQYVQVCEHSNKSDIELFVAS